MRYARKEPEPQPSDPNVGLRMLPLESLPSSPRWGAETVVDSEIEGIEQPGTDF